MNQWQVGAGVAKRLDVGPGQRLEVGGAAAGAAVGLAVCGSAVEQSRAEFGFEADEYVPARGRASTELRERLPELDAVALGVGDPAEAAVGLLHHLVVDGRAGCPELGEHRV